MKVYLIRHGTTQMNKEHKVNGQIDEPLVPEGIDEVKLMTSSIPKNIKHIYSSSMLRAKQTAEIISEALNVPFSLHDELREINMGHLAGKSWAEMEDGMKLKQKHRTVTFDYRSYGGESLKNVQRRLTKFLKKINGQYQDFESLFITHGGIIRVLQMLENNKAIYDTQKQVSLSTFDLDKILKNLSKKMIY